MHPLQIFLLLSLAAGACSQCEPVFINEYLSDYFYIWIEVASSGSSLDGHKIQGYENDYSTDTDLLSWTLELSESTAGSDPLRYADYVFSEDGMEDATAVALVNPSGGVVQFICLTGTDVTPSDGAAKGTTCTRPKVNEPDNGASYQLTGDGSCLSDMSWAITARPRTFGFTNYNQNGGPTSPPPSNCTEVFLNEVGDSDYIELAGPAGMQLVGYTIDVYSVNTWSGTDSGSVEATTVIDGSLSAEKDTLGFYLIAAGSDWPSLGSSDPAALAISDADGRLLQFVCTSGMMLPKVGPAAGLMCHTMGPAPDGLDTDSGESYQLQGQNGTCYEDFTWGATPVLQTIGFQNVAQNRGSLYGRVEPLNCTTVFFNEIRPTTEYGNYERFFEVAGPRGSDLSSYSIAVFEDRAEEADETVEWGDGAEFYSPGQTALGFSVAQFGFYTPEAAGGVAIADSSGKLLHFLCYGGAIVRPVSGIAAGVTCDDSGISFPDNMREEQSMQLTNGDGSGGTCYEDFIWDSEPAIDTQSFQNYGQNEGPPFGLHNGNKTCTAWINEVHYVDNSYYDVNEFIEIAGPAGTDLTGYTLELYDKGSRSSYNTVTITSGSLSDTQDGTGIGYLSARVEGLQNAYGGIALSDAGGILLQFLCYEHVMLAGDGSADGIICEYMGDVFESGDDTRPGNSLRLTGTGECYEDFTGWNAPDRATEGFTNWGQNGGPVPSKLHDGCQEIYISEFFGMDHSDFLLEGVEIMGPVGTKLDGYQIAFYNSQDDGPTGWYTFNTETTIAGDGAGGGMGVELADTSKLFNHFGDISYSDSVGIALVDAEGKVVQFICQAGMMKAVDGLAAGVICEPITLGGVLDPNIVGDGLEYTFQLEGSGRCYQDFEWTDAPKVGSFGSINDGMDITGRTPGTSPVIVGAPTAATPPTLAAPPTAPQPSASPPPPPPSNPTRATPSPAPAAPSTAPQPSASPPPPPPLNPTRATPSPAPAAPSTVPQPSASPSLPAPTRGVDAPLSSTTPTAVPPSENPSPINPAGGGPSPIEGGPADDATSPTSENGVEESDTPWVVAAQVTLTGIPAGERSGQDLKDAIELGVQQETDHVTVVTEVLPVDGDVSAAVVFFALPGLSQQEAQAVKEALQSGMGGTLTSSMRDSGMPATISLSELVVTQEQGDGPIILGPPRDGAAAGASGLAMACALLLACSIL